MHITRFGRSRKRRYSEENPAKRGNLSIPSLPTRIHFLTVSSRCQVGASVSCDSVRSLFHRSSAWRVTIFDPFRLGPERDIGPFEFAGELYRGYEVVRGKSELFRYQPDAGADVPGIR